MSAPRQAYSLPRCRSWPGWEACGVEPAAGVAETARRVQGLTVHTGDLASTRYPNATFDAVTLWDVLEHLHEPLDVLVEVRHVLKEDGLLIMRTPSLKSWDARLFGRYWAGLDSPRHLALFQVETASMLLEKAGFEITSIGTGTGSYIIFLLSLRFWLADFVPDPRLRSTFLRLFDNPVAKGFALLPFAIADRLGYGAAMTIVARPRVRTSCGGRQNHD